MSKSTKGGKDGGEHPGCPMHGPATLGKTDLTYNSYLKIPELLELQVPQSQPAHHDEMLFIVIHQAYELWFKLVLHEMENAIHYMEEGQVLRAHHFLNRIVQIMKLMVQQIHILETMSPVEFLEFRDRLMPASGFQSTQFREIEFLAGLKDAAYVRYFDSQPKFKERLLKRMSQPDLRSAFYALLAQQGLPMPKGAAEIEARGDASDREHLIHAILPIYQRPSERLPLYLLSEALVEFDEYLALWREHHVRVVERVIGFKKGTGGSSGVGYLQSTTSKKCFPCLWEVRTYLVKEGN